MFENESKSLLRPIVSALMVVLATLSFTAEATTDCVVKPTAVYSGNDTLANGGIWLLYTNPSNGSQGGGVYIDVNNVNTKNMLAVVLTAIALNNRIQIRLQSTGANCFDSAAHGDWLSVYMLL
jgi:hypothetical protein